MTDTTRTPPSRTTLSKEEEVLAWSALAVLVLAIAFTIGAIFAG